MLWHLSLDGAINMDEKKSAVQWAEIRYKEMCSDIVQEERIWDKYKPWFADIVKSMYEKAVWIDANIKGGCVIDPARNFHFYEIEDATAFKLKWEE